MDAENRRFRAVQVGMLMRAYRHAFADGAAHKRLSQGGLLDLMGQIDPGYLEKYDHSTVARWESGATYPTADRLKVFGKALNLSEAEVNGLISLAGVGAPQYIPHQGHRSALQGVSNHDMPESRVKSGLDITDEPQPKQMWDAPQPFANFALRFALIRLILPGSGVIAAGYGLAALGWDASWMLMLYVLVAIGIVLTFGFLRMRGSNDLREFLFVSVFFVLSAPLLALPLTGMDHLGFYAIGSFANTPMPVFISLALCLILALIAGLMFDLLSRWQYSARTSKGSLSRASWVVFPPLAFVFACIFPLANVGGWIQIVLMLSVLGGVSIALMVLRDEDVHIRPWDRKFLLWTTMAITLVLTLLGGVAIAVAYLELNVIAIADHNLIRSWDLDFSSLGYPSEELPQRFRLGFVWVSIAQISYMVFVVGGRLIVTVYRLGTGDGDGTTADATLAATENRVCSKWAKRSWPDFHSWAGWLAGRSAH